MRVCSIYLSLSCFFVFSARVFALLILFLSVHSSVQPSSMLYPLTRLLLPLSINPYVYTHPTTLPLNLTLADDLNALWPDYDVVLRRVFLRILILVFATNGSIVVHIVRPANALACRVSGDKRWGRSHPPAVWCGGLDGCGGGELACKG